jgi:hypothetical protein
MRSLSSLAAALVNVNATICSGVATPVRISLAMCSVIVAVLPEPAPAMMRNGPRR